MNQILRSNLPEALSLQAFLYLQILDVMTTWIGLRAGLGETSAFIRLLMGFGPVAGLLMSKMIAVGLAAFCVWKNRFRVIHIINYWYALIVVWNLTLLGLF